METKLLIWSKDRACQLHLLLESLEVLSGESFDIEVIYKASSSLFEDAYSKVAYRFKTVSFVKETDFYENTVASLKCNHRNFAFSTDDTVCIRPFSLKGLSLNEGEVFSLRLGLNTIVQDMYRGAVQPPLNRYKNGIFNNIPTVEWNPLDYHPNNNYGYPTGLDLHVFNREKMCALLCPKNVFKTTNQLETYLFRHRHHFSSIKSFKESVAVNIPFNNMSGITTSGVYYGRSVEELNKMYLAGLKIDLSSIMSNKFVGCHQEVDFSMVQYG